MPRAAAACGVVRLGGRRWRACKCSRGHRPSGCGNEARDRRAALRQQHPNGVGAPLTRTRLPRACRLQWPWSPRIVRPPPRITRRRAAQPTPEPGFGVDSHARRWHTTPGRSRQDAARTPPGCAPGTAGALEGTAAFGPSSKAPAIPAFRARCPGRTPRARTFALGPSPEPGPIRYANLSAALRPRSRRGRAPGSADMASGHVIGSLSDQQLAQRRSGSDPEALFGETVPTPASPGPPTGGARRTAARSGLSIDRACLSSATCLSDA